jgi:hypothetical protein
MAAVQQPVSDWLKARSALDYVDAVTEPGVDNILANGRPDQLAALREKVMVSVARHSSHLVAVAAHHDCAGNPVSRDEHLEQLRRALDVIGEWRLPVAAVALWVNDGWQVEVVGEISPSVA